MASPFHVFRRHSRVMMAALVILCMGLFVFSRGSGGSSSRDGRRAANATVATWNGGSINEQQLASLVQQRIIVDQFLRALFQEGGGVTEYDLPTSVPQFLLPSQRVDYVQQVVIQTEAFASLARQAGIAVSDRMVNHYIEEFGLKKVSTAGVQAILSQIGQRNLGANEALVFDGLRKLLMAHFFQVGNVEAGYVVTPLERWNDWRQVEEKISLQAAVISADKFLDKAPEPTEAQLQALYNDYKDAEPNLFMRVLGRPLPIADPGFRAPRQVRLHYVQGSVAQRAAALESSVTEEEIADYYERNKRTQFVKSSLLDDAFGGDSAAEGSEGDQAEPKTSDAASTDGADAADGSADEPKEDAAGDEAAPAEEDRPAKPAEEEGAGAARRSPFRFVAAQAPASETAAANESADEASGDETTEAAPASDTDADDAAADDESAAADGEDPAEEEPQFEPLDKVRDDIRTTLATDKAVAEMEETFSAAAAQLQTEFNRYASRAAEARELKKDPPAPGEKLQDLKWFAEKQGLTPETTALLNAASLSETALGKAIDAQQQRSVLQAAFGDTSLYEPILARDINGDWFLAVKTEDVQARSPEFADIRDDVVAAWKRREAAKLAEAEAKKLAEEARKATQSFSDFFADRGYDVVEQTEMFSWRSYVGGPGQGSPILSSIEELPNVGGDFMEAAFALDGEQTAAVMSTDRKAAYVMRLHSRQYEPAALRQRFLEEATTWLGQIDMLREHVQGFVGAATKDLLETRGGLKLDEEWVARRNAPADEEL